MNAAPPPPLCTLLSHCWDKSVPRLHHLTRVNPKHNHPTFIYSSILHFSLVILSSVKHWFCHLFKPRCLFLILAPIALPNFPQILLLSFFSPSHYATFPSPCSHPCSVLGIFPLPGKEGGREGGPMLGSVRGNEQIPCPRLCSLFEASIGAKGWSMFVEGKGSFTDCRVGLMCV